MQDVNPTRENEFHRMQLRRIGRRGDMGVNVEDTRLGFDMSTKKKWRVDEAFKG